LSKLYSLLSETLANPRLEVEKNSPAFWPAEGGITFEVDGKKVREGGCSRKIWYRLAQVKKDTRGKSLKALLDQRYGNFAQNQLTETAKIGRFYLGDEVPIQLHRRGSNGDYLISGSIDIIVQDPLTGMPFLVEVKSTGKAFMGQVIPDRNGRMAPNVSHVIQCLPYLAWAKEVGKIEDPEIHIFYIDRSNHETGEHVLRLNANTEAVVENVIGTETWPHISLNALYEDFNILNGYVKAGAPPPQPYKYQYDNDDIVWMYKTGRLNKTDSAKVERVLEKSPDSATNGKPPILVKGDFLCRVCEFRKTCYGVLPIVPTNDVSDVDLGSSAAEVPI
jgi:hypothetical protein